VDRLSWFVYTCLQAEKGPKQVKEKGKKDRPGHEDLFLAQVEAHLRIGSHAHVIELLQHEVVPTANADVLEARLLFPWCSGGTLAETLERTGGGMREEEALSIFVQLAAGVAHCHACGVTNRDVKLTNVYRCEPLGNGDHAGSGGGRWVVADFGSALLSDKAVVVGDRAQLLRAREEVVELTTPEYRAPEQVSLELGSRLGSEVDAWALGVVLHQLSFNANPFATPLATLSPRRLTAAEETSASLRLRKLLQGLLRRDATSRLSIANALALAEEQLTASLSIV